MVTKIKVSSILRLFVLILLSIFIGFAVNFMAGDKNTLSTGKGEVNVFFFRILCLEIIPALVSIEALDRVYCLLRGWKLIIEKNRVKLLMYGIPLIVNENIIESLIVYPDKLFGGFFVGVKLKKNAPFWVSLLAGFRGILGSGGQVLNTRLAAEIKTEFPVFIDE
jgi:hypothetical protein